MPPDADEPDAGPRGPARRRGRTIPLRGLLILIAIAAVLLAIAARVYHQADRDRHDQDRFEAMQTVLTSEAQRVQAGLDGLRVIASGGAAHRSGRSWSIDSHLRGADPQDVEHPVLTLRVVHRPEGDALGPIVIQDLGGSANPGVIAALVSLCRSQGWPCRVAAPDTDPEVAALLASEGQFRAACRLLEPIVGPLAIDRNRYLGHSYSTLRSGGIGSSWSVHLDATPSPQHPTPGAIRLTVSSETGSPALIEALGHTEANALRLSSLTDAFDTEGWPYTVCHLDHPPDDDPRPDPDPGR